MEDKISIIMGIYNCEDYLDESIDSILNQSYTNWELIMCDDGSTDNTYSIAKKYSLKYESKIILLKNEKNMGLNYTLNKCLNVATGDFIARQDGDDISLNERLKTEIEFLKNNNKYDIVSSNMIFFDSSGDWGKTNMNPQPGKLDFLNGTPFCHAPSMVRREAFLKVNGYTVDEKFLRVEDYELWLKMYLKGFKGYNLKDYLYKMRNDQKAINRRTFSNRINEVRVKKIIYKKFNLPFRYKYKVYIPILKACIPKRIYKILYKIKNKECVL